jgi:hypothetical protein
MAIASSKLEYHCCSSLSEIVYYTQVNIIILHDLQVQNFLVIFLQQFTVLGKDPVILTVHPVKEILPLPRIFRRLS